MEVVTEITNVEFGKMINVAANALKNNAEKINKLNVFPVPDGDTGTNMTLSMASGAEYERQEDDTRISALAKATSKGLLMGARGNSGVILSQIFRGFASAVEDKDVLTARGYANALMGGAETAYKAVMKPTEGTILTVIREAAAAANQTAKDTDDVVKVAKDALAAAEKALASTPDLLPVLKEVGVVDSGGQGLVIVLEAFTAVLAGEEVIDAEIDNAGLEAMIQELHNAGVQGELNPSDIEYGYCTEIMVDIAKGTTYDQDFDYDTFYNHLAGLGDSLLVINDDEVVKVHVHTEQPGEVLEWGTHFGSLRKVKVDNMRDQQAEAAEAAQKERDTNNQATNKPAVDLAVITVAAGKGVQGLFTSAGATVVLDGIQAPSTKDIAEAINNSGAKAAIILPNDSNIFMAAAQAVEVAEIPTRVVKTRTVQQGLTALVLGYDPTGDMDTIGETMDGGLSEVVSGSLTTSVRETTLKGLEIHDGDAIGLLDGEIVVAEPNNDMQAAAQSLLQKMIDDDAEIVTIIFGEQVTEADAKELADMALAINEDLEIEIHDGGQPLYPFLISVE